MVWRQAFELGGVNRLLPMEGIRGLAVILVFLQHYSVQFLEKAELGAAARWFALSFRQFGNMGVELFFVLSGYLIYGLLLRRRPRFLPFMARRAERLYPAFLVACVIGAALDIVRPQPKIPAGWADALLYLGANLAFLPGLFPIEPLFAVNWSLSYEWWFYVSCTLLVLAGFGGLARIWRMVGIALLGAILLALGAEDIAHVPMRGLPLLAGMLLAELSLAGRSRVPSVIGLAGLAVAYAGFSLLAWPAWAKTLLVTLCFTAFCAAALQPDSLVGRLFSWRWLRWLGNMSYSFYLVHGFAVVIAVEILARVLGRAALGVAFWILLAPVFTMAALAGGLLFLAVEKPWSLSGSRVVVRLPA